MATKNLQKQVLLFSKPAIKMISLLPFGISPAILAPKTDSAMRKGRLKFFPNFYRMRVASFIKARKSFQLWKLDQKKSNFGADDFDLML